jgi:hypothetical protein
MRLFSHFPCAKSERTEAEDGERRISSWPRVAVLLGAQPIAIVRAGKSKFDFILSCFVLYFIHFGDYFFS